MKQLPFVRVSTRITKEQSAFIKLQSKKNRMTEGEMFRFIIASMMRNNNKIK